MPRTVFHTAEGGSTQGLKAEYFSNTDFSGKPVLTRVDPQIQFDWDAAAPVPGVSKKAFAVRWTGTLTPPGPGDLYVQRAQASVASGRWNGSLPDLS